MLFHIFAHVDADNVILIVEEKLSERAGELGLADAGGSEENKRAYGPVGILQACA